MNVLEGQILQSMAYVMLFQTEIASEHYKTRKVERGVATDKDGNTIYRPLTEVELLDNSIRSMRSHVQRIGDLIDMLPEGGSK